MDFQLSEDQQALKEGVRTFCDGRISADQLRELEKEAFDRDLWGELAEMGVFGLRLPESEGGVGLGSADAVVVFEELGRCLAPGPLVWSHLLAGRVEGAASGECVVGGLDLLGRGEDPVLVDPKSGVFGEISSLKFSAAYLCICPSNYSTVRKSF